MKKCKNCKYFCHDYSTGTSECAKYDDMTEEETERYYVNDEENCPYWNDFESNDDSFLPLTYAEIERIFKVARSMCPNITDDMWDSDGAINYMNVNDSTPVD